MGKPWSVEDANLAFRELAESLRPIGIHVMMMIGPTKKKVRELELMAYPNVGPDAEPKLDEILSKRMRLLGKRTLSRARNFGGNTVRRVEMWSHGSGKNARPINVFLHAE